MERMDHRGGKAMGKTTQHTEVVEVHSASRGSLPCRKPGMILVFLVLLLPACGGPAGPLATSTPAPTDTPEPVMLSEKQLEDIVNGCNNSHLVADQELTDAYSATQKTAAGEVASYTAGFRNFISGSATVCRAIVFDSVSTANLYFSSQSGMTDITEGSMFYFPADALVCQTYEDGVTVVAFRRQNVVGFIVQGKIEEEGGSIVMAASAAKAMNEVMELHVP
jgi:hypothetical protein